VSYGEQLLDSLSARIGEITEKACRLPFLGVFVRAALREQRHLAKDMSASIAFFTFLSLFPLFLGIFALAGMFLDSADVQERLGEFLTRTLPASADVVTGNIETLIRLRGTAGVVSVVLLLWSGSKMVGALSRGINNALGLEWPLDLYLSPLRNFALTLTVSILVLATIALAPVVEIITELDLGFIGRRGNAFLDSIAGRTVGFVASGSLLSAIYWLVPYQRLPWRDLLPGILVAAVSLEIAKQLFVSYLGNLSRYDAIYGSVSSIIVLLVWLYFSARMVLYCTEVIGVYRESRVARAGEAS
jgi:membrane protein